VSVELQVRADELSRAKKKDKPGERSQVTVAIIGAMATVIVALIGIVPIITKTIGETPAPTPASTLTPGLTNTTGEMLTPTLASTPTPGLMKVPVRGKVLRIDLPDWATDPVRGSITFNRNDEITASGKLMVYLTIRDEQSIRWLNSEPEPVLELHSGEKLCGIVPAEYNSTNYWLGFQAHCASNDACSYNIEGRRLWVTINDIEIIIAPQEVQCPER
jgi:hypothetical protein